MLGIGIAAGEGVSVGLLVAIFISNLPEAIGSSTEMSRAGRGRGAIMRLWIAVAVVCTLATVAGWTIADTASGDLQATIDGFAAGALLVMLIDSMIPEAARRAGNVAGPGDGARVRGRCRALEPRLTAATSAPAPAASRAPGPSVPPAIGRRWRWRAVRSSTERSVGASRLGAAAEMSAAAPATVAAASDVPLRRS